MSNFGSASIPTPLVNTGNSWLRFAPRHIHATVVDYLEARLAELGWTGSNPPLGSDRVTVETYRAPEADLTKVKSGQLYCLLGEESASREEELGGPLSSQSLDLYVDMFMATDAHAISLGSDVKDIFMGRVDNGRRALPVYDHAQTPPTAVPGWVMSFENVVRLRLDTLPVYWQQVQVTLWIDYPEVVY